MTAITYDGATPTVGADADVWGTELNVGALAKIKADLDMLNAAPANTILGRNEGTTGEVERLTPTEVMNMFPSSRVRVAGALITTTATTAVLTNGFNIASVTWGTADAGNATVAVVFSSAMANANYHVDLSSETVTGGLLIGGPNVFSDTRTVNGFTLKYRTESTRVCLSVYAAA